jgi:hypothetical protein
VCRYKAPSRARESLELLDRGTLAEGPRILGISKLHLQDAGKSRRDVIAQRETSPFSIESTSQRSSVMAGRTTRMSVTFSRPFSLTDIDGIQPAGTYRIQTIDVTLDNLSFLAFRPVSTTIELPAVGTASSRRQVVTIDPLETRGSPEEGSGRKRRRQQFT